MLVNRVRVARVAGDGDLDAGGGRALPGLGAAGAVVGRARVDEREGAAQLGLDAGLDPELGPRHPAVVGLLRLADLAGGVGARDHPEAATGVRRHADLAADGLGPAGRHPLDLDGRADDVAAAGRLVLGQEHAEGGGRGRGAAGVGDDGAEAERAAVLGSGRRLAELGDPEVGRLRCLRRGGGTGAVAGDQRGPQQRRRRQCRRRTSSAGAAPLPDPCVDLHLHSSPRAGWSHTRFGHGVSRLAGPAVPDPRDNLPIRSGSSPRSRESASATSRWTRRSRWWSASPPTSPARSTRCATAIQMTSRCVSRRGRGGRRAGRGRRAPRRGTCPGRPRSARWRPARPRPSGRPGPA